MYVFQVSLNDIILISRKKPYKAHVSKLLIFNIKWVFHSILYIILF